MGPVQCNYNGNSKNNQNIQDVQFYAVLSNQVVFKSVGTLYDINHYHTNQVVFKSVGTLYDINHCHRIGIERCHSSDYMIS